MALRPISLSFNATSVDLTSFLAPFDKCGDLLRARNYDLVPFKKGALAALPAGSNYPPLNFGVMGISDIVSAIPNNSFFDDLEKIWQDLIKLDLADLLNQVVGKLIPDTFSFAAQQVGLLLSLAAALGNPAGWGAVQTDIEAAFNSYFFEDGYTITPPAAGKISPPSFNLPSSGSPQDLVQAVRSYATLKTAEQYTRDLIRITVESAGNSLFKLESRYANLPANQQKWFKGLASAAESTTTSAVEQVAQGLGSFSTSPLISGALGTFAGTCARKATQDAVLLEFNK